ncbi:MAG: hypothetical protein L0338_13155 [Acidobacteria bacterium]|nr:hypothetical protein [Acidobacteriota bacterium]
MSIPLRRIDVIKAVDDLKDRTLASIPGELGRLVYLASTRDYNSGRYVHEGLAWSFTDEVAREALATCHQEVFEKLLFSPLEELTNELASYFRTTGERTEETLLAWSRLEPYRLIVPLKCSRLAADLFVSNIKVALAILGDRLSQYRQPTA